MSSLSHSIPETSAMMFGAFHQQPFLLKRQRLTWSRALSRASLWFEAAQYIMVEAQAAVAARDAVIAEQAAQIEALTAQVATLSLNASGFIAAASAGPALGGYTAAASVGPAQGAAARGAATMATREVGGGGGYQASTINVNVTLPSSGSSAAAGPGGWAIRDEVRGGEDVTALPSLPPHVQKCVQPGCHTMPSWSGVVLITKAGTKYDRDREFCAIRGRDVQHFAMRFEEAVAILALKHKDRPIPFRDTETLQFLPPWKIHRLHQCLHEACSVLLCARHTALACSAMHGQLYPQRCHLGSPRHALSENSRTTTVLRFRRAARHFQRFGTGPPSFRLGHGL